MIFKIGKLGADVSFYQDDDATPQKIDFVKMKAAGASFVILRAGQNLWEDEDYRDYSLAARQANLPQGAYYFYDSRAKPSEQMTVWKNAMRAYVPPVLVVDLEESYGGAYRGERYWKEFLNLCKAEFPNSKIMIYTANWWWSQQTVGDQSYFGNFPLWVAEYPLNVDPVTVTLPFPWRTKQAHMWQFTSKGDGKKYGVESLSIDLNYWNDFYDFNDFWKTEENGGGNPMPNNYSEYTATLNVDSNMRTEPGVNPANKTGTVIRAFVGGSTVKGKVSGVPDKYGVTDSNGVRTWMAVYDVSGETWLGWICENLMSNIQEVPPTGGGTTLPASADIAISYKDENGVTLKTYTGTVS